MGIVKAIVDNKEVSMRKGMFGWRVVHPIKNSDGKINWINLLVGGWGNFLILIFILFILTVGYFGLQEMLRGCNDMAENPCRYTNLNCQEISAGEYNPIVDSVRFTAVNLSEVS